MLVSSQGRGDLLFLSWLSKSDNQTPEIIATQAFSNLAKCLKDKNLLVLHERIYGNVASANEILTIRETCYCQQGINTPIAPVFVEGLPTASVNLAGVHIVAIAKENYTSVQTIEWRNNPCGILTKGQDAEYLCLSDIAQVVRNTGDLSPAEESSQTFQVTEEILKQLNWSFRDVKRTWFYLHNILDWYHEFNRIRNEAFKRMGLFNGNPLSVIPASTGIWGRNMRGGWCTMDLIAMRPLPGKQFEVSRLVNPRQNEATSYGSAFSRALSVKTHTCNYLFISGTASIDEHGKTIHIGDFRNQTIRTIQNVNALLSLSGANLQDICQATAFVKYRKDVDEFYRLIDELDLTSIPMVCTIADVCRDDLLFELDATAILPK